MNKRLSRYFGDKAFYKMLMAVAIPIMLQNGLTNLVSLLDNIMVGAVGTEQMTGVSIVNQLLFVFNLCIFGGLSGAGIFTAQFFGKNDQQGVRDTFRFKLLLVAGILAIGLGIFCFFGDELMALYLHEGGQTGDIGLTAQYGAEYLGVMLWGLLPFAFQQVYASTLRETGETVVPMKAGIMAIFVNLCLNYVLIFGHFGAPAMGAAGAALATVIARYVECFIIVGWTHRNKMQARFIVDAYKTLRVPMGLVADIFKRGMPLLVNEFLWSAGMAVLTQSYSTRGLAVVAALNIASTISNLFSIAWMAMGTAVGIIVAQNLGAGEFDKAEDNCWRIATFSVLSAAAVALFLVVAAPLFPMLYNTTDEVRWIAAGILRVVGLSGILHAFNHVSYFTLRSGGKTWITFLFDSVYLWCITIPLARILSTGTLWDIVLVYAICQFVDVIKCVIGYVLLKKRVWVNRIV